jgi:hypothetical protein
MTGEAEPQCDECGSTFIAQRSAMDGLCAECAHRLYGYPSLRPRLREWALRQLWLGRVGVRVSSSLAHVCFKERYAPGALLD